jgi:hypothetical protein
MDSILRSLRPASWYAINRDPVDWAIASVVFCSSVIFSLVLLASLTELVDPVDGYFDGIRRAVASAIQ